MDANLEPALTRLAAGALLRVVDPDGRGIAVLGGSVWITQQDDTRDVFVADGEAFTFDRPGLALVQALQPSRLVVFDAPQSWSAAGGRPTHSHPAGAQRRSEGNATFPAVGPATPRVHQ